LQGANGVNGVNGSNGSDGKNGSDAKNIATASTVAGPVGPKGAPGTNGSDGAAGSRGSDGSNGANGSVGATGPAGSGATGATGSNGINGSNGANGTDGAAGATGATGARGETGTVGLPEIRVGTLTFENITGSAGSSSTSNLNSLMAGKSYLVRLMIYTYHPANRFFDLKMPLDLSTASTSGSPIITKQFVTAASNSYRNGVEGFEWSLSAEITIDGSLVTSDYGLAVTVTAGKSTTSQSLAILCDFSALLVGEVK
jgi:hypothetical protein